VRADRKEFTAALLPEELRSQIDSLQAEYSTTKTQVITLLLLAGLAALAFASNGFPDLGKDGTRTRAARKAAAKALEALAILSSGPSERKRGNPRR